MVDDHSPQEMSDVDLILYTTRLEDGWMNCFPNEVMAVLFDGTDSYDTTITINNKEGLTQRSAWVELNFA